MPNEPPTAVSNPVKTKQRLRVQRLGMSFASQGITFLMVILAWHQGAAPLFVVRDFALLTLLINGAFLLIFFTNLNLRTRDPSLTGAQMLASMIPPVWVVYFLADGQARASILFIAIISALYGMFSLDMRRFLKIAACYLLTYAALIAAIWINKPEFITPHLELMQGITFTLVMTQIAVLGGFISGLRKKLRKKNAELSDAMEELKSAMQRISTLANTDELTGVDNRRSVLSNLDKEVNRFNRVQGPFSVALIDLDYFKVINDTHGHQAGDIVLKTFARCVKDSIRSIDNFGRYGGEEFLLVLPQTQKEGALIKAERIREMIESLSFTEIGEAVKVSVSIGIAEHRGGENSEDTLLRADKALYRAKDEGRNRCMVD